MIEPWGDVPSAVYWEGQFLMAEERIATLEAEVERLREELEDGNAAYHSVMKEACSGGITYETDDRLHCTCVPHLREGVRALQARVRELEAALSTSRGQWIHSVNAEQCLAALREPTLRSGRQEK